MKWIKRLKSWLDRGSDSIAAPVVAARDAGFDTDHRLPGDPLHVVRIDQAWAEGRCACVVDDVAVAVSRRARRDFARFFAGSQRRIWLERRGATVAVLA